MIKTEDIVLQNLSIPSQEGCSVSDLLISNGYFSDIVVEISPTARVIDCTGLILLPGFVDAHVHLDKTIWGEPWFSSPLSKKAALNDLISNESQKRSMGSHDPLKFAPRLLKQMIQKGTTALRSHIDIDLTAKLDGVRALLEVRENFKDSVDIELVAFPQSGILQSPGVEKLMDEALKMGVDVVGGLDPAAFDRDPVRHLDVVFGLAAKHGGRKIDIHLHENGSLGAFSLELIAERAKIYDLCGKVTVSHAFALGALETSRFRYLLELLEENDIALVTSVPGGHEFAPHDLVTEAGINYALGSDNIRDYWAPFGNGDMLDRALQLVMRRRLRNDKGLEEALAMATFEGAKIMGLRDYGTWGGCRAHGVLLKASCIAEAVALCPNERAILRSGRFVASSLPLISV